MIHHAAYSFAAWPEWFGTTKDIKTGARPVQIKKRGLSVGFRKRIFETTEAVRAIVLPLLLFTNF